MKAARKLTDQDANLQFDPKETGELNRGQSGKRLEVEPQKALPLRWPNNRIDQGKLFDTWHDVAAQIINDKGGSRFRLLSSATKLIYWKIGIIPATNEQWALSSGRCALKTVTRDIELYRCLGVFIVQYGWRKRKYDGKIVRTRIIFPSLPETLNSSITLNNDEIHMDISGPYEWGVFPDIHTDHSGLDHKDHSGLGTLDTCEEGGNDAA